MARTSGIDLELDHLSVTYGHGRGAVVVVDQVDLSVPAGSALGIVGESGSGKSSLARAIVGLAPLSGGKILLNGTDATRPDKRDRFLHGRVQMVFQDPFSSLNPRMTVGHAVGEVLHAHGVEGGDALRGETALVLSRVGLDPAMGNLFPGELSGGQRQRAAIARALAANPEILIADEVTSSLDVSVQASILNLLRELRGSVGFSLILISHNLAVVRYMCDRIAVMYLGRVVEIDLAEPVLNAPRHPYTKTLFDAIPRLDSIPAPFVADAVDPPDPRNRPSGCPFHPRCPVGPVHRPERTRCRELDPYVDRALRPHRAACHYPLDDPALIPAQA